MRAMALILLLAACGNIRSGDVADAVSTSAVVSSGATELNPLVPTGDPIVAGVSLLAIKVVGKEALIGMGHDPERVNAGVSALGWGAACYNLAAAGPAGLALAIPCAGIAWDVTGPKVHTPEFTVAGEVAIPRGDYLFPSLSRCEEAVAAVQTDTLRGRCVRHD